MVRAQFRRCKGPDAHDLVDFPSKKIKSAKSCGSIRIALRYFVRFLLGNGSYDVHTQLPVRRRAGKKYFPRLVLLFHPYKMLIQANCPFFTRFYRTSKNQIPLTTSYLFLSSEIESES